MTRTKVRLPLAIAAAVLAIGTTATAGGGCHGGAGTTEIRGTTVDAGKNCFEPTVLRVNEGESVAWKNYDPIEHTITAAGGLFDAVVKPGETFSYTFESAGVYPYYCLLHARMAGAVVVGESTVSQVAANPPQPVAQLGDAPEEGTSARSAALIAVLVAAPLSFAAGRILRGRPRIE